MNNIEKVEQLANALPNSLHTVKNYHHQLPSRTKNTKFSWNDEMGIRYTYDIEKNNILVIYSPLGYFPDTIIDYINALPKDIEVIVFEVKSNENETAGINLLTDCLRRHRINKNIIVSLKHNRYSPYQSIDYQLPSNAKISSTLDFYNLNDNHFFGETSFDWWCLHLNNQEFKELLKYLTPATRKRIENLRQIAQEFYNLIKQHYPNIDEMNNLEKTNIAFNWVLNITKYDHSSTIKTSSGVTAINPECYYASDPIATFKRRKGVCTGRARLLKAILNNCFMKVPCFLTSGKISSGDAHEWVEVICDKKRCYFDLSFGIRGVTEIPYKDITHSDYGLSEPIFKKKNDNYTYKKENNSSKS